MNAPANDTLTHDRADILASFISFTDALLLSLDKVVEAIDDMPPVNRDEALATLISDADALYRESAESLRLHKVRAETLLAITRKEAAQ